MSPARTRRTAVPLRRSRRELATAIGSAVAIVAGTALLIWLMRPGNGQDGTGGLFERQPRATLLVVLALAAFGGFAWWILRGSTRRRKNAGAIVAVGGVVILGLAVLAGVVWPGGLLHHPVLVAPPPDLSELQEQLNESTATAPSSTTTAPAGDTSSSSGASSSTTGSP